MNKTATTLMAAAMVLPLLAAVASANTNSDLSSENDFCDAVDADGVRPSAPTGGPNPDYCDGNDGTGGAGSEDTSATVYPNGGTLLQCLNDPTVAAPGSSTTCHGGALAYADTASGYGNFGGDYPIAGAVVVTNAGGATFVQVQVCYVYVSAAGAFAAGDFDCTAFSAITCLAAAGTYTITVGGAGATDPPAGTTIDEVDVFRVVSTPPTACGQLGAGQVRTISMDWQYVAEAAPVASTAAANQPGGAGTALVWGATGTTAGTAYGQTSGWLFVNGDSTVLGWSETAGPAAGPLGSAPSDVTTGINACAAGDTIEVVGTSWQIGTSYSIADSGVYTCA